MIARIWSGESPLWLLLLPLSWLYGLVSGIIRLCYQLGIKKSWRAPCPVVVVGNLTAGGNGKTPVVIWLVEQLQKRGIRPGVVSRGYGGKAAQYPLLLAEKTTTAEAGDEPVLIFQRTGAPVAVSPVRSDAVQALPNEQQRRACHGIHGGVCHAQPGAALLIIALIIDLVKQGEGAGTWQASHFSWRIRTVIWAGVLYIITAPLWLLFFFPGWVAWGLISIWFLYRIVRGMVTMNKSQAIDA